MKKQILNIGTILEKKEQKEVFGGDRSGIPCINGYYHCTNGQIIWVGACNQPHIAPCN